MRPLKSTPLSITEARAERAGRGVFYGGVAQWSEHPLDKRAVVGSTPATTTKGTYAGGQTPAASLLCGGSTMVVRRSAKSKAAGSSPVPRSTSRGRVPTVIAVGQGLSCGSSSMVERRPSKSDVAGSSPVSRSHKFPDTLQVGTVRTVAPEWKGSGVQPRRLRQRRFDSVTVLHPLNSHAVRPARQRVCSWGSSSMVERHPVSVRVVGSIPTLPSMIDINRESWRGSSVRSYKGRPGGGTGLQNQSAGFDSLASCQQQQ